MHSGGILNDLELRKNENKDGKLFPVAVFETIWNCRKNENKDGKCIVHSDGIWNDLYLLCQDPLTPHWPSFLGCPGLHQWETIIDIVYEHLPDTAE